MTNPREKRFAESIANRRGLDDRMVKTADPDPMGPRGTLPKADEPEWEYKNLVLADTANLNAYAADGWEPCGMLPRAGDKAVFHLRRRKRA